MRLEGKIVLVTGASRGVGYYVAKKYIEEGAHVITLARTIGGLEELDDYAKSLGRATTIVPIDLEEFEKINNLGFELYNKFGKLDIFIGNAAILGECSPVGHISPKIWQKVINVNLTANWYLLRSLDPLLKQSDNAKVIFSTCDLVKESNAFLSAYNASKIGLESLVNTYSNENKKTNITVKLISLPPIQTSLRAKYMPGENLDSIIKPENLAELYIEASI